MTATMWTQWWALTLALALALW